MELSSRGPTLPCGRSTRQRRVMVGRIGVRMAPPGLAFTSDPTITSSQDGRLELFVIGGSDLRGGYDGALWHKWQLQKIDDPTIHKWSGCRRASSSKLISISPVRV